MAVSKNEPVFLKAIDATDQIKNVEHIARLVIEVINEDGPPNVIQLNMDLPCFRQLL